LKKKIIVCLILFISPLFSPWFFAQDNSPQNLNQLIQLALENNPKIQLALKKWQAEEEKITLAKSLPDPMLTYGRFGESIQTKVGPQKNKFGLSQKIPFLGKLGLKEKSQQQYALMAKEQYEAVKREIIQKVKSLYYDLFWVDKAIQTTEGEKAILETLEKVARKRYESNLTPQQDVIKAQVAITNLIDKLLMLRQNEKSLSAELNSILNRPEDFEMVKVLSLDISKFDYKLEELQELAKNSTPELMAADMNIKRFEYEKSLAKKDYFPDFNLGFDYIQVGGGYTTLPDDGQDSWMVSLSVNVPIWFGKLKAEVKEKDLQLQQAQRNYDDMKNNVYFQIEDLYFKILAYKDSISLYETSLIPQTEQSFDTAKTGYETGKVDFLNWLDSERVLLQTRLAYYKAITDYQKSIAFMERVLGTDL